MEKDAGTPLLEAMMLLQSVILSCIDRKQFPYSKSQLNVFTALVMEGEMTMKRVARYLACSQEQATRAVAPLADAGYVERRTDPSNRTRVYVGLTEKGKLFLKEQSAVLKDNLNSKLNSALNGEEKQDVNAAAETLAALLKKVKAEEK